MSGKKNDNFFALGVFLFLLLILNQATAYDRFQLEVFDDEPVAKI